MLLIPNGYIDISDKNISLLQHSAYMLTKTAISKSIVLF